MFLKLEIARMRRLWLLTKRSASTNVLLVLHNVKSVCYLWILITMGACGLEIICFVGWCEEIC